MTIENLNKIYANIISLVYANQVFEAIQELKKLATTFSIEEIQHETDTLYSTYENMLRYGLVYGNDPERDNIYNRLCQSILNISDSLKYKIEIKNGWYSFQTAFNKYKYLLQYDKNEKTALISSLAEEREFQNLIEQNTDISISASDSPIAENLEKAFYIFLLANEYKEAEKKTVQELCQFDSLPVYDKSLMVTSVTMSLLLYFDIEKLNALFQFYNSNEERVWQRALVGIVLCSLYYEKRLKFYPEFYNRLKSMPDAEKFASRVENMMVQYLKARDTEKISKRIQEEILPEVMKMKDDLQDKLKLEDLISKAQFEDKNPDWEEFFGESSNTYKKFEEFSMMQMEGNDVFMSAFAMLKNFPFFQDFMNWFLPFYKEHPKIKEALQNVGGDFQYDTFLEGIEKSSVLCNSDKYSFCFNIQFMPELQRNMMMEMFNMEIKAMNELEEEENKHSTENKEKVLFTQYLQDLYRFFKLHRQKDSFPDLFGLELNFDKSDFLKLVFSNAQQLRNIAEFYFSKNHWEEAIALFGILLQKEPGIELYEKIAFCYQKLGQYTKAINNYKKAELIDGNKTWLMKKLAFCFRKTGQFDMAISYYEKIQKIEEENPENLMYLGLLHIDVENYKEALKYYFKVEYQQPNNIKIQRPIGWCNFVLGKQEQAIKYFEKVVQQKNAQVNDYLNLGHANWVGGNVEKAIENYRIAFNKSGNDKNWLLKSINNDRIQLEKQGISSLDISLLTDFILNFDA